MGFQVNVGNNPFVLQHHEHIIFPKIFVSYVFRFKKKRINVIITWICGRCSRKNNSLQSSETCVRGARTSRTSIMTCIDVESNGKNFLLVVEPLILLWALTRACNSLDFSNSLKNTNSSSDDGSSFCSWAFSNDDSNRLRAIWRKIKIILIQKYFRFF